MGRRLETFHASYTVLDSVRHRPRRCLAAAPETASARPQTSTDVAAGAKGCHDCGPRCPVSGTYVYRVRANAAREPKIELTSARLDAYRALWRVRNKAHGLTVREVALACNHPKETTQQLVKWLVENGLAIRERGHRAVAA
jgi:hypothetical protein